MLSIECSSSIYSEHILEHSLELLGQRLPDFSSRDRTRTRRAAHEPPNVSPK